MNVNQPLISIGMPVYNGENFIAEAIDSLLAQTFTDFELIISDNASTDRTPEICQAYASKDPRIRYYRNEQNIGSAGNFNRVFELSRGEYFKLASHDDLCSQELLSKYIKVLKQDPTVVLCYSQTQIIDEKGTIIESYDYKLNTNSSKPQERFQAIVCDDHKNYTCLAAHGLMRASAIKRTPLFGCYAHSDRIFLARLSLLGSFHQIPEYLFFYRMHRQQSIKIRPAIPEENRNKWLKRFGVGVWPPAEWWDPTKTGKISLSEWRAFAEYLKSIQNSPLNWYQRGACYLSIGRSLTKKQVWARMIKELIIGSEQIVNDLLANFNKDVQKQENSKPNH